MNQTRRGTARGPASPVDVLVVGARPHRLGLAAQLGAHGTGPRLIDRNLDRARVSRRDVEIAAALSRLAAVGNAQLLRADLPPEALIAPPAVRQVRARLRYRVQLVRPRTLLRNRIHAVLADHGQDRIGGCWSGPGRQWLAGLDLPAASREVIEDRLAVMDALQVPIDRLDVEVHEHATADPRVTVLTGLPGVGTLTALVILAEIGDIGRFGSARKLAAWAGLTPTVRALDRTVWHGHISTQGSTWLRWIRCEAAQTAKRSPGLAATYQAIARRRGKKIATTAIARRLLTRAYHLLADAEAATTTATSQSTRPAGTGPGPQTPRGSPTPGELAFTHEPAQPRSMT